MKRLTKALIAGALSLGLMFGATTATVNAEKASKNPSKAFFVDFKKGKMPKGFEASHGWTNGNPFQVNWYKDNVRFINGKLHLIIDKDPTKANGIKYSGGEFRSIGFYGYGRYSVRMKTMKNDGVVWSFFTYTGPTDNNPWDEIDIEILGRDTTKVQFNYFRDGKGEHEYLYDLGFDSADDFHTYAFEWHKDKIIWFVDDKAVHEVTAAIPVTKAKVMMNAWAGMNVDDWLKPFVDKKLPIHDEYEWISFIPFEDE